jgi:hypothetical protein
MLTASLRFLTSYAGGMGVVDIHCFDGCSCEPARIDAHRPESANSVFIEQRLKLRVQPGSIVRACGLQVAVLNLTSSGGHKFKLRSVTVTAASQIPGHGG